MDHTDFERIASKERHLIVFNTLRADGSIQSSVVNAGLLAHPVSGNQVLAIVARGRTVKLSNIRRNPRVSAVVRSAGEWAALEGQAELIGPDDAYEGFRPDQLPRLLRDIFAAAGGTHDDWDTYDRVMAEERRAAILVSIDRLYSNRARQ